MDTKMEDKMYHQIEKSLSNNINENLFTSGRVFEKENLPILHSSVIEPIKSVSVLEEPAREYLSESIDHISQPPALSRTEYIRQARESCLRQLSNQSAKMMDSYNLDSDDQDPALHNKKKAKALKLFKDSEKALRSPWNRSTTYEENSPEDIASFQSLVIRTICSVVLFLCIFLIDKFDFSLGTFSKGLVREYITSNDSFVKLEQIVVTWLK